jgi:acyl carrier protein
VILQTFEISDSDNPKSKIQNPKSDLSLVAYISADEDSQSLGDLLHSYLSTRLPNYMIPTYYVILPSLPLSPNGKVDYRALPPVRFSSEAAIVTAPRNEIEAKLHAIFAEVLGRADFAVDDNFFRIGGHSLLAARAAARIGDAFGVSLALSTFLETPTVMALAKAVESLLATGQTGTESDKEQREEFEL